VVHEPLDASYGLETTEKPGIAPQVEGNCATGYVSVALDRLGKGGISRNRHLSERLLPRLRARVGKSDLRAVTTFAKLV
jgi:hypothetical protein